VQTWDRAITAAAIVLLGWLFYKNAYLASRLIDGTRYFVLDDDMMISMRYARNLAEGNGLVWNLGERVEGYTNFLWTVIMAGAHFTGVADVRMSLVVKAIGFAFMAGSFHLSVRILRVFAPRSLVASLLLVTCMIMCVDIIHWSVWGFETSLLTFLDLYFIYRVLRDKLDVLCFGALALIPLVRGDGMYIFVANAFLALVLAKRPRRALLWIAVSSLPLFAHFAFRHAFYGEWLPNTYFLKVYKLDGTHQRGAMYARNFLLHYSILLTLAAGAGLAIVRTDRRGLAFFVTVLSTLGYVLFTGGDMFGHFRFFAHVMPIIFIFAAAGLARVPRAGIGALVWGAVLFLVCVPLVKPFERLIVLDVNGDPYEQMQVAALMRKNALPTSSVAVITAGILPYFTRMRAIDILGKSDKHIARLTPTPGAMVGHGKLDPAYTLGQKPDFVVSCRAHTIVMSLPQNMRTIDPVLSFLAAKPFQDVYRNHYIDEPFTLGRTTVYTRPDSPEYGRRSWKTVQVSP
jgi:arabinofuranosyltransferase